MNEEKIRRIVREELLSNDRSGTPKVPPHKHNGDDNLHIDQKDVIPNTKFMAFGTATNGPFTLNFVSNPTSLRFYGFAANNAGGGAATQRATITGEAQFGKSITITTFEPKVSGTKSSYIQASNYVFTNQTGPAFRAGASSEFFAYASDGSSNLVIAAVTKWEGSIITVEVALASGWQLTGAFLVT